MDVKYNSLVKARQHCRNLELTSDTNKNLLLDIANKRLYPKRKTFMNHQADGIKFHDTVTKGDIMK